jgi:hypothetical protein
MPHQGHRPGEDVHHGGHGTRRAQEASRAPSFTAAFKAEIVELCQRGDRRLREDVEILKRVTAFFVKETR